MKAVLTLVWVSVFVCTALVQSSASPDLEVLQASWSKDRIGWEQDPFIAAGETDDERRLRLRHEKRATDAKSRGSGLNQYERDSRTDAEIKAAKRLTAPPRYVFVYELQVRNTGRQIVTTVFWDYVFYDAATKREVGRRQFISEQKINPGKKAQLRFVIRTPPALMISVHSLEKREMESIIGQVEILRIEYQDGSVWKQQL